MSKPRVIERYSKKGIWFHWIHTVAFVILLVTGLVLFFPGTGAVAAGGFTRMLHRAAAVLFVLGPVVYFVLNPKTSLHFIKETLTWGKDDMGWAMAAPLYYFGAGEEKMPPQGHVNTGQKMWQVVVLGTGVLFLLTGIIMWFFLT